MANIDTDYLNSLVTRFKAYKRPNDTQRLIIALGELQERSDDDNKKLSILIRAEKKADELAKARAATSRIMNAEKTAARKLETRKKVIWGAALKTAAQNDAQIAQMMRKLYNEGYVSDKDKDAVRDDYEAIQASHTN
ncbi:HlyD family secretion protein [Psychrobacter communis]|uniref:Uncharacterized protein n=1 Tax=Psychrobacter communis TaxID=2762238 RepID=A0ABR8RLT9_9GAMM|nr:hypothetical protein [Psychrobacter communis]MBD7948761.1 hypothetical protein [Psychrobacter communis]